MEAVAPTPITFRLTPRAYQYEAVAALLAAPPYTSPAVPWAWASSAHTSWREDCH